MSFTFLHIHILFIYLCNFICFSSSYNLYLYKTVPFTFNLFSSKLTPDAPLDDSTRALMLNAISDVTVVPDDDKVSVSTAKVKKARKEKLSAKDMTGYQYSDKDGSYDVPIILNHMWYRVNVRKASEKKLCEMFTGPTSQLDPKWSQIVVDAYYPQTSYVTFKGKNIELKVKPMIPGLLYLKTQMGPDIADDLEKVAGIYGFTKTSGGIVVPLGEEEASQLEKMITKGQGDLNPELKLIKKEGYVSVIAGEHAGRYGIVMGARSGRIEVCLRSEYKDDWDMINVFDLRYLDKPPEKKWNEMTAKEAVESLMSKDPKNPTIRALRKQGLLEEILYPEGNPNRKRLDYVDRVQEGGKSLRSIAKPKEAADDKTFRSFVTAMSNRPADRSEQGNVDYEKQVSSATTSFNDESDAINIKASSKSSGNRKSTNSNLMNDVDSFIADLLNDMDGVDDVKSFKSAVGNPAQITSSPTPKMEDFTSFEDYLDALVNFEKQSPAIPPKLPGKSQTFSNSINAESDAIDDSLLDLFGPDDSTPSLAAPIEIAKQAPKKSKVATDASASRASKNSLTQIKRASGVGSQEKPVLKKQTKAVEFDYDLEAFFKELEST